MVRQVRLPNGQIGQFPDTMSNAAIENVLQQQFGSPEGQDGAADEDPMQIARSRIDAQYPNMPDFLKQALLSQIDTKPHPELEKAARGISKVTDVIPAAAGGILEGAALPIRGIAGLIPTGVTQRLAQTHPSAVFPKPEGVAQKTAALGGELLGGGAAFGPLVRGGEMVAQAARIPESLQTGAALAGAGALGTPGTPTERAAGAALGAAFGAPQVAAAAARGVQAVVPEALQPLVQRINPREVVRHVRNQHDNLFRESTRLFDKVTQEAQAAGLDRLPVNPEAIAMAQAFLPKSRPVKRLIDKAKTGDFASLRKLQSDLGAAARKRYRDPSAAVRDQAFEADDMRDLINEGIHDHLERMGREDLSQDLHQARNLYRQMRQRYYEPNHQIAKMVDPYKREMPKNPMELFGKEDEPMAAFRQLHPEVNRAVDLHQRRKRITNALGKHGSKAMLPLTGAGAMALINKIFSGHADE